MSFNINSLVLAGCGGANPLVAASQKIAVAPRLASTSTSTLTSTSTGDSVVPPGLITNTNFAAEFERTHYQPQSTQLQPHQSSYVNYPQPQTHQMPLYQRFSCLSMQEAGSSTQTSTAADQLEAKYRSEVLERKDDAKLDVDKMSVWQMLSLLLTDTIDNADRICTKSRMYENGYIAEGKEREAAWFNEMWDSIRDSPDELMRCGLMLFEQGHYHLAQTLFERLTTLKPDNAVAWRYRGLVCRKLAPEGKMEVEMDGKLSRTTFILDHTEIDMYEKCLSFGFDSQAKLLLSKTDYYPEYYEHLFDWLACQEKYKSLNLDEAEFRASEEEAFVEEHGFREHKLMYLRDKYIEAARLSPVNPDPDVQAQLGFLFCLLNDYPKSIECLRTALSVRPDDADLWLQLAETLRYKSDYEGALVAAERAFQLEPFNVRCQLDIADYIIFISKNLRYQDLKQLCHVRDNLIRPLDDSDMTDVMVNIAAFIVRCVGQNAEKFKDAAKEHLQSLKQ